MYMTEKFFLRKEKEKQPVLAICYDFDKTLSPDDMQSQGFIQDLDYKVEDFWHQSNELAEKMEMDQNSAWMYSMYAHSEGKVLFTRKIFEDYGSKIKLFEGVEDWFERIQAYGKIFNVTIEHYIISSGLKEMIEGTSIFKKNVFEKIYASSFYYNDKDVAIWPAQIVNYTNKTQFLFRIEKGVLDINDQAVNDYFPPEKIRVPFRNMVYIGDSDTDIPCMKLVNANGGHSIGVYNPISNDKSKVYRMFNDNRIKYYAPADYREGSELDRLVKLIIERTSANEKLEEFYYDKKKEVAEARTNSKQDGQVEQQNFLIEKLKESNSFLNTHQVISELQSFESWSEEQRTKLYEIAIENKQVFCILGDQDLKSFFKQLISKYKDRNENTEMINEQIEYLIKEWKRLKSSHY